MEQEENARRDVQQVDDEVDQTWTAACEWTAKKMLKYLEDSEVLRSARENGRKKSCLQTSRASEKCASRGRREVRKAKSCFRFPDKEQTRSSSPVR